MPYLDVCFKYDKPSEIELQEVNLSKFISD